MDADRAVQKDEEIPAGMIRVKLSERNIFFPEDTPTEVIERVSRETESGDQAKKTATGHAKATRAGATEGLIESTVGAPKAAVDISSTLKKATTPDWAASDQPWMETVQKITNPGRAIIGEVASWGPKTQDVMPESFKYEPQTTGERYTKEAAKVGTGFMVGGPKGMIQRGLGGGTLGLFGQLAEEGLKNPTAKPVAEAGGLAAYVLASLRKGGAQSIAGGALKDVGEQEIRKGQAAADKASEVLGTRVTLNQAIESPVLQNFAGLLQGNPYATALRNITERQLGRGKATIEEWTQALTNTFSRGQDEANRILEAGKTALSRPEKIRREGTKDLYEASKQEKVNPTILDMSKREIEKNRLAREYPGSVGEGKEMLRAEGEVMGAGEVSNIIDPATGKPLVKDISPLRLKNLARQYEREARPGPFADPNQQAAAVAAQSTSRILNDLARAASPNIAKGDDIYAKITKGAVEPMERSGLRQMFPESMTSGKMGDWEVYTAALNKADAADIPFIAANLNRADPTKQAFAQIVQHDWTNKFTQASKLVEGRPNQNAMGQWAHAVAGPPGSPARLRAQEIIRQIHGPDAVAGFDAVIDALQMASRDRAGVVGEAAGSMAGRGGENIISTMSRSVGLQPGVTMGRKLEQLVYRRAVEKLQAAILTPTDPKTGKGAADALIEIARWERPDEAAKAFIRSFMIEHGQDRE